VRRLIFACVLSLAATALVHATLLDRSLTHGTLSAALQARLERAAAIASPKLVVLAGSNGQFSHRCEVLEAELGLPCVNGGLAVGIGLDYLFARWDPLLGPGDTVYLPMEPSQYVRTRLATAAGPDAAIMARHDRATLARLTPERWAGAVLGLELRGAVMAGLEMALARAGFTDPRAAEATNEWGDRTGHTPDRAALAELAAMRVVPPDAAAIRAGYGAELIADFTRRMAARGVRVIGGLSVGFADAVPDPDAISAIAAVYTGNGGMFLALPNQSRYPRPEFFDGPEHLAEPGQIAHSRLLSGALAPLLDRGNNLHVHAE